jgi:hypothetical protein
MKYVYVAGPYTGPTHDHKSYFAIDRHIMQAAEAARDLAVAGIGFFCPHTHSAHFEVVAPEVPPSFWYELDIYFMGFCDAILMLPGWQESTGSCKERQIMMGAGKPVFYDIVEAVDWAREEVSVG